MKATLETIGVENFITSYRSKPVSTQLVAQMQGFLTADEGQPFRAELKEYLNESDWKEFSDEHLVTLVSGILREPALQNRDGNGVLTVFMSNHVISPSTRPDELKELERRAGVLASVMETEILGRTNKVLQMPVHMAVLSGYTNLAETLVDRMHPRDLGRRDGDGCTPLHSTIQRAKTLTVNEVSVQPYASLAKKIIAKMEPEHLGLQKKNSEETALHLIVDRTGLSRGNIIQHHFAMLTDFWPVLEDLLVKMKPMDVMKKNAGGQSALMIAEAIHGNATESATIGQYFSSRQAGARPEKSIGELVGLLRKHQLSVDALLGGFGL